VITHFVSLENIPLSCLIASIQAALNSNIRLISKSGLSAINQVHASIAVEIEAGVNISYGKTTR
jgi:hypothetical protein